MGYFKAIFASLCVLLVTCEAGSFRVSDEVLERVNDVLQCFMHIHDVASGVVENNLDLIIGSTPEEWFSMCRQSQTEDELELTSQIGKREIFDIFQKLMGEPELYLPKKKESHIKSRWSKNKPEIDEDEESEPGKPRKMRRNESKQRKGSKSPLIGKKIRIPGVLGMPDQD
ncbi:hypothetical protein ScPMuIL_006671 [Solemya velum]